MKKFEQFENLYFPELVDEIFNATENLYLAMPSIDDNMASVLISAKKQKPQLSIHVIVDNSEEAIRNGFGDIEGIDKLLSNSIQLSQSDGNLISFIISDFTGYFLFPHSRIFIERSKGTNAFRIDPVTIEILKKHFFRNINELSEFEQLAKIGYANKHFQEAFNALNQNKISPYVSEFDTNQHKLNKDKLKINPPNPPDLQRQINIYIAKIQLVELKYIGGNIQAKIIKLPSKAMPIKSDKLKKLLQTRIKMFHDIDGRPEFKKLIESKAKVENLRKQYLIPIASRPGKSIVRINDKDKFLNELNQLKEEAKSLCIDLATILEEGKLNTLDLLKNELNDFFFENELDELKRINQRDVKERRLEEIINKIIASVKLPDVNKLINEISLTVFFYDLTWNDFKDKNLIEEFREKKIMEGSDIAQIVKLKDAYETKN